MSKVHDKEETLNVRLGVSNERTDVLGSRLMAHILLDFKTQRDSGEYAINEGYETCEGIKSALAECQNKEEALLLGMNVQELTSKFSYAGIDNFVHEFEPTLQKHGESVDTLAAEILKQMQDQN